MDTTAARDDLIDLPLGGAGEKPRSVEDDEPRFDALPPSAQAEPGPPRRPRGRPLALVLAALLGALAAAAAVWLLKPTPAVLAPAEPMLDFQDVRLGSAERRQLTVANRGETRLAMVRTDLGGADAADFAVTADDCSGLQLAQGESCALEVAFEPTARGRRAATLVLEAEAANAPRVVPLLGHGTAPEISVAPSALAFGPQLVGSAAAPREVRVANRGTSDLAVDAVTLEGAAAGDFAQRADGCRGRTLAPGDECAVAVRFLPTVAGPRRAILRLKSGAGDSAQVAIEGQGVAPEPLLRLSAARLDLGVVPVGESAPTSTLAVANDGSAALVLDAIEVGGADADVFAVDAAGCLAEPIAAASGCTAALTVRPPRVGPLAATLRIVHAGGAGEVALSAVGVAPQVRLVPLRIGLGEVAVRRRSAAETLRVENVGMAPLRLERLTLGGANAAAFALRRDDCSSATLTTGQACSASVAVTPGRPGPLRAEVVVRHNAGSETVPITAFGVAGRLAVEPDRLEFAAVEVGTARERRLVLRNRGRAPLTVRAPSLEGKGRAAFRVAASSCAAPLAPGASCTLTVAFLPSAAGTAEARLRVGHDGDGAAASVDLAGRGQPRPAPRLSVTPPSIDFGPLPVAARSEIETVRLTNAGDSTLELRDLRITGRHAADFHIVPGSCTGAGSITAGQSCTVGVRFTPSAPGARQARLELDHGADGARLVGLVGSGL